MEIDQILALILPAVIFLGFGVFLNYRESSHLEVFLRKNGINAVEADEKKINLFRAHLLEGAFVLGAIYNVIILTQKHENLWLFFFTTIILLVTCVLGMPIKPMNTRRFFPYLAIIAISTIMGQAGFVITGNMIGLIITVILSFTILLGGYCGMICSNKTRN
ncbi:MAG: hypothetical protein ACREAD_03085 [Nitrosopumilaceae archaeon]